MTTEGQGFPQKAASWAQNRCRKLYRRLQPGLQSVLLIAAIALLTVGIDPSHQPAAADLPAPTSLPTPQRLAAQGGQGHPQRPQTAGAPEAATSGESYLDFDAAIAKRLSHRELTRPILTGSLMTRSHLLAGKTYGQRQHAASQGQAPS
jgi:hypothetical protein